MRTYAMQWVILALSLLAVLLLGAILWSAWKMVTRLLAERAEIQSQLLRELRNRDDLNRNLMDRLMSQDLQTYATMTTLANSSTKFNDEYVNRSDEAEYARLNGAAGVVFPVGDTIFTEQDHAENFVTEIGLDDLTSLAEQDS